MSEERDENPVKGSIEVMLGFGVLILGLSTAINLEEQMKQLVNTLGPLIAGIVHALLSS